MLDTTQKQHYSEDPKKKPRILFVSSSWPLGPTFGGQIRALHLGHALQQVGAVTLLVVGSEANDANAQIQSAAEFDVLPSILPVVSANRSILHKFRWAVDARYLNLHGYAASAAETARVETLVAEFDLVWVLNSRTPNILQLWKWSNAHLDIDDVPSTYLQTVSKHAPSVSKRWKARVQQHLLRRRELLFKERFTTTSVCSRADKAYLGDAETTHVIPNGFARPSSIPVRSYTAAGPRIGFIGLFSYAPNLEGVRWFLKECWPTIRQAVPGIRLRLIGKDTDGPLKPTEPDVDALGFVTDPAAEIATWSSMIVPIRFGGGTRIKIAEAFSRKVPAVSTSVGAFGYEVEHGKQLLLADRPEDFSAACIQLVKTPKLGEEIAERAWNDFLTKWTWDAIAPKVVAAAEDCLRRSKAR